MRFLADRDLIDLLPARAVIEVVEESIRDFAADRITVPARQHLDFGNHTLLLMAARGAQALGVKMVSVVPSNSARGAPVTRGLMTLSDPITARPLAVLEVQALTAQRTGAVGALGLKYTTPPDVESIGVIGTGVQGMWQAIFACAVRPIRDIYFVARSDNTVQRFMEMIVQRVPSVRLQRCGDARELLNSTQVVIAATTSSHPVLPEEEDLLRGKHFVSVGSFRPDMQELPIAAYALAQAVVVDSDVAKYEAGDLTKSLACGSISEENIVHLAELASGKRSTNTNRTTVFKSVGSALFDIYVAQAFLAEAVRLGRGTVLHTL